MRTFLLVITSLQLSARRSASVGEYCHISSCFTFQEQVLTDPSFREQVQVNRTGQINHSG